MSKRILIVGSGFAGLWGALGAARILENEGKTADVEIALVSPEPVLHMRPRLHETEPERMGTPIAAQLEAAGVRYIQGAVERIDAQHRRVEAVTAAGERIGIDYDRLLLTTGSKMYRPDVPGLLQHGFSVDQYDEAVALDQHLKRLAAHPPSAARNTVAIVGGGFTGIEVAAEMPERLRAIFGENVAARVVLIERSQEIGPELGSGPRPVIEEALGALGVECQFGSAVVSLDGNGVTTADGTRIDAMTVVWTGGVRASGLTAQITAQRDHLGRLLVADDLRVHATTGIFAAGDVASAATDEHGNQTMMACQHAIDMGRYAGHNIAADLLGLPTVAYRQPFYVTCLDLGGWGAVYTEGWERKVKMRGAQAKALKTQINTKWIYPPDADRAALFKAADWRNTAVA
ncbi:NAD(P)/FAD-dependent oxidoreductase [Noviherbaspirillum sp.]|uniref:NAD(P)/FAD-dependent oxidoreductase n=1 Tax=Noviherbaspirillum sp. TaxID=1926288 RepID=UPI002D267D97|nr:FAD-dependent oxidoreductase [Noviherbaspirillum sp.]HZW20845.1 FAD-dependent oxidoreductase [Noviherbaspirillum sp.]